MDFIINNWLAVLMALVVVCAASIYIYKFFTSSKEEQIATVRRWLLWAVIEAEKEFGSGTGKLKLHSVYDMFVSTFPWMVNVISFKTFSNMVDDALDEMNELLSNNLAIFNYVEGTDLK